MDIPLNAEVRCTDGAGGRSTCLVINPVTKEITHLVVQTNDFFHDKHMVPLSFITESGPDYVQLRCSREEIANCDPFIKSEFLNYMDDSDRFGYLSHDYELDYDSMAMWPYLEADSEASGRYVGIEQIPIGELGIHPGARVEASDGHIGRVDAFLVNPENNNITHLVLREGHIWGEKDVTVAVADIQRINEDVVYLKLDKHTLRDMPGIPVKRWGKRISHSDHK
jgi:sporulation protein YlmC with PRC-barrel domain